MPDTPATVDAFLHCSGCGGDAIANEGPAVRCEACGWTFFTNVAAAAAVLLEHDGQLLLVRRQREPARGKLGIPGGFVDPGEDAAHAACRELREELFLELQPSDLRYLTTVPNVYPFEGVTYRSLDVIFAATLPAMPTAFDETEIAAVELVNPRTHDPAELAFDATRAAVAAYLR